MDEAKLAANILERDYSGFLEPLTFNQGAPPGFLFIEKFLTDLLGSGEMALRLFPLICGIAALVLIYFIGRRFVGELSATVAAALFAVLRPPIYYSGEVKQYSTDVVAVLVVLWLSARCLDEQERTEPYITLALVGGLLFWCSHAAMMASAGVGLVLFWKAVTTGSKPMLVRLMLPAGIWAVSFVPFFIFSLTDLLANDSLSEFWTNGFAPLLPTSTSDVRWYHDAMFGVFEDAAGVQSSGVGLFAFLVGGAALMGRDSQPWKLALLVSPIFVTLFISGLEVYPFSGRTILFASPILVLVLCRGLVYLWNQSKVVGIIGTLVVFVTPLALAADLMADPPTREELRPVLVHVHEKMESDDEFYVYTGAVAAFQYYEGTRNLVQASEERVILGGNFRSDWEQYRERLGRLWGKERIWFVFSHVHEASGANEEQLFLFILDRLGSPLRSIEEQGASAHLYDLGG